MKFTFLLLHIFYPFFYPFDKGSDASNLAITFENLKERKGTLYIAIYNDAKNFLHPNHPIKQVTIPVAGLNEYALRTKQLKAGEYAVAVFLDINGNGQLDTNILGIPTEPYGFSGTKHPKFRAPKFDEAAFSLTKQHQNIRITLK